MVMLYFYGYVDFSTGSKLLGTVYLRRFIGLNLYFEMKWIDHEAVIFMCL